MQSWRSQVHHTRFRRKNDFSRCSTWTQNRLWLSKSCGWRLTTRVPFEIMHSVWLGNCRKVISAHVSGKFGMYVCMYVLVYTSSLLRVLRVFQNQYKQTNLSKSPKNPQVICTATWSLFPGGHWPLYDGTYSLWWVPNHQSLSWKVLRKFFHWYRLRDRTANLLLGSRMYYHLSHRCSFQESLIFKEWTD